MALPQLFIGASERLLGPLACHSSLDLVAQLQHPAAWFGGTAAGVSSTEWREQRKPGDSDMLQRCNGTVTE